MISNRNQRWRYLAKTKGQSISISSTYIAFVTKMQKGQTPENGFALLKNDITTFELALKFGIHSRYQRSDNNKTGPFLTLLRLSLTFGKN